MSWVEGGRVGFQHCRPRGHSAVVEAEVLSGVAIAMAMLLEGWVSLGLAGTGKVTDPPPAATAPVS
jgi:hypothetical protein